MTAPNNPPLAIPGRAWDAASHASHGFEDEPPERRTAALPVQTADTVDGGAR
jgi:hypothetical protein